MVIVTFCVLGQVLQLNEVVAAENCVETALEGMGSSARILQDRLQMRAAGDPDRLVETIFTSKVITPLLQGLERMHNNTVQRRSKAGVKCNIPL